MTPITPAKAVTAGVIAAAIGLIVTLRIGKRFVPAIPFLVLAALAVLCLIGIITYLLTWQHKAKRKQMDPGPMFAFWQDVIRYFIATDMIMFALQKIFHLQFSIPIGVLDNPFSSLSGEELMWAFFGKFYAFTLIIAALQITAAIMLLFSKTRLAGIVVLLPILFNILLLDWFYDLGIVVNLYITLLTLATVYLLLTEYSRLKAFFFLTKSQLPVLTFKSNATKNILRASAVIIPVILMACYRFPPSYPDIFGKYEIKASGITYAFKKTCPDTLTKIFIDDHDFVFQFGSYENRYIGTYEYNELTKEIKVTWHYPETMHDTLKVNCSIPGNNSKNLKGQMGTTKINIYMLKVN